MIPLREISDYIKAGKKVQAVKLVRESTGFSLRDAKEYVDELELMIKNNNDKTFCPSYESAVSAIDGMEGHEFEYFCADLLRKIGFTDVTVTPGSGDQGVDVLATKDYIKYAVQCKNYASALGNTPVQEVAAGKQFYGCHVGVVMTNSTFTPGAIQLAAATNVLLWDREKLDELISQAGGLESLGIYTEYDDSDTNDEFEDIYDYECIKEDFNGFKEGAAGTAVPVTEHLEKDTKIKAKARTGRGLKIWSKICFGWSVICILMFLLQVAFEDGQDSMTYTGVFWGEGVFVFILGLMFHILSKSEKGNPYLYLCGKSIKKNIFIILCIIIAYTLFLGIMGVTGSLS